MPTPHPTERLWGPLLLAICLVAINLRMTITGLGPLIEQIAADQGVTPAALGGLAAVPLLAWAAVSPLAHGLSMRFGISRVVTWSLVALAVGTVWRSLPGSPVHLWLGTAFIGAALAIGNVLIPAVIRRDFPSRIPFVMGLYTGILGTFGAVSAGLVVPVSQLVLAGEPLGWRGALLATGVVVPCALVAWLVANRWRGGSPHTGRITIGASASESLPSPAPGTPDTPTTAPRNRVPGIGNRVWGDPVAWSIAGFMGMQSMMFYTSATWLAPIRTDAGSTEIAAGLDVMFMQVVGIAGSLALPLLYRGRMRRWMPAILPAVWGVAFVGIVLADGPALHWILLSGFCSGALLSMSLLFMAVRAREQETASALSGMAQSVGYLIAAAGPIAFGWLHSLSGEWTVPLWFAVGAVLVQVLLGLQLGRGRMVFERRPPS